MQKHTLTIVRGVYMTRSVDILLVNIVVACALGIGAGFLALAVSLWDVYPWAAIALGVCGGVLALITLYDRLELEYRHYQHGEQLALLAAPRVVEAPKPPPEEVREIPVTSGGQTSALVLSPADDALIAELSTLLGHAAQLAGDGGAVFPPYRALGFKSHAPYDRLLRALGRAVHRKKGEQPSLVDGFTFGSLQKQLNERALLPYRLDAPASPNRL